MKFLLFFFDWHMNRCSVVCKLYWAQGAQIKADDFDLLAFFGVWWIAGSRNAALVKQKHGRCMAKTLNGQILHSNELMFYYRETGISAKELDCSNYNISIFGNKIRKQNVYICINPFVNVESGFRNTVQTKSTRWQNGQWNGIRLRTVSGFCIYVV